MTKKTKKVVDPAVTSQQNHSDRTGSSESELCHVLGFEMRGYIQSIRANTELLKYWKAQTLDHNTITFLDKIEGSCIMLDELVKDCLVFCSGSGTGGHNESTSRK